MKRAWLLLSLFFAFILSSCRGEVPERAFDLATTTSIENSGLLQHLAAAFEQKTGISIRPFVVGSGRALRLADQGRVQVILTHDPEGEQKFVANGKAAVYRQFARNDFIIVGPPANPAGLTPADVPIEAFRKIHVAGARFVSRGDESGTHVREMALWREAGIGPAQNSNYLSLGQSMSALLRSADQLESYTLTDRATFEQIRETLDLVVYVERGSELTNTYAVTLVKTAAIEQQYAREFVEWLISEDGLQTLESFRVKGKQVFFPLR